MRRVCSTQRRGSVEPAKKVRLGDVCSAATSQIRQKDIEGIGGRYPIYGASGMVGYVDSYQLEDEGIGIVKDGAGVGRVMRLPKHSAVIGTILTIRPTADVDVDYLFYVLCRQNLWSLCTGATIPHLYFKDFKDKTISLPTLAEQKRIAAVLDKICELKKNAETRLEKLDTLVKSRFVEMFGDCVLEATLPEICTIIDGDRGKNYPTQGDFSPEGYCLFLNAKNVTKNGFVFETTSFITQTKDESLRKGKLLRGDVVLTTRGTIGNIAFFDQNVPYDNVRINSGMVILRVDIDRVNPVYFIQAFKSKIQDVARRLVSGTAQPQLPISIMSKIMLPLPPLALQREFAAFVAKVDKLAFVARQTVKAMDTLYRAKLQEFFG